jgi:hypothetical protein
MKIKPVYVATPEEVQQSLAPTTAELPEIQPALKWSVGNMERFVVEEWQSLSIFFESGDELDCDLLQYGTYWLHVQTEHGPRLINKASIEQIAPRVGGA